MCNTREGVQENGESDAKLERSHESWEVLEMCPQGDVVMQAWVLM